jgi:hypothetical protein
MTRFSIFIPLGGDDMGAALVCYRAAPMEPSCTDSEWMVPGTSEDDPMYRKEERKAVINECAKVARAVGQKYDNLANELFRKDGEWRARHKETAACEIEEAILALTDKDH